MTEPPSRSGEGSGREDGAGEGGAATRRGALTLTTCGATHFLHDGFSAMLYLLLPVWQAEFGLSLAQAGLLRGLYTGSLAAMQMPAGLLAERSSERGVLAAGTVVAGVAFIALGWAGGFAGLAFILIVAGIGASVQHPLCASLVSKAYETGARRAALGVYNFTGDLGKLAVPGLAALAIAGLDWRWATAGYGGIGVLAAVAIFITFGVFAAAARRPDAPVDRRAGGWGVRDRRGFRVLAAIGIIDNATIAGFLTFLPFFLTAKGAPVETVGLALTLVFTGGAAGKFLCGVLAERVGIIRTVILTELLTGCGILVLLTLSPSQSLILLPFLGVALNGTSSVLFGTVAELTTPEGRSRAFALFYTLAMGAAAMSPWFYGAVSDRAGVAVTLAVVAVVGLATIPLTLLLRPALRRSVSGSAS